MGGEEKLRKGKRRRKEEGNKADSARNVPQPTVGKHVCHPENADTPPPSTIKESCNESIDYLQPTTITMDDWDDDFGAGPSHTHTSQGGAADPLVDTEYARIQQRYTDVSRMEGRGEVRRGSW